MNSPQLAAAKDPRVKRDQIRARHQAGVTCELRFSMPSPLRETARKAVRSFAPHFHPEYQLILAQHSVVEYRYRGATTLVPPRSLMIFAPEEVHAARGLHDLQRDAPLRTLFLSSETVEQTVEQEAPRRGCLSSRFETEGPGFQLALKLHRAGSESASTLLRDEALQRLLLHLRAGPATGKIGRESAGVERARAFLQHHHSEEVSLHTLSRHAGLSPFHLCRVFRAEVGVAPHEFQLQLRTEAARGLILRGMELREVALECGFADQSHFCREFKKRVGVSPGRYLCDKKT